MPMKQPLSDAHSLPELVRAGPKEERHQYLYRLSQHSGMEGVIGNMYKNAVDRYHQATSEEKKNPDDTLKGIINFIKHIQAYYDHFLKPGLNQTPESMREKMHAFMEIYRLDDTLIKNRQQQVLHALWENKVDAPTVNKIMKDTLNHLIDKLSYWIVLAEKRNEGRHVKNPAIIQYQKQLTLDLTKLKAYPTREAADRYLDLPANKELKNYLRTNYPNFLSLIENAPKPPALESTTNKSTQPATSSARTDPTSSKPVPTGNMMDELRAKQQAREQQSKNSATDSPFLKRR